MKWQELSGEERYRVVELARKGETTIRELCRMFGVSRQTLYRAMEVADRAAMAALEPKPRGRKPRTPSEVRTTELENEKEDLAKELKRWQQKYEVAKAILDLQRRAERGERLPGEKGGKTSSPRRGSERVRRAVLWLGWRRGWSGAVIAEAMGITQASLRRWQHRNGGAPRVGMRPGRPQSIPPASRERIRTCYAAHYGQWGPQVLRQWCRREGPGIWSAGTIAAVIEDLRMEPSDRSRPTRYEITASGVMWSEDGTGFRERGRKKELLVIQDDHARLKLGHRLTTGPAGEDAVYEHLAAAFAKHGAPLVLKHDGGSIFQGGRVAALLAAHQVTDLTGPRSYPQYNGKQERSMRDIKSYERAMRRHGVRGTLQKRLAAAVHDLNEERPRPLLGGRTAREAYEQDRSSLPDRGDFLREVGRKEQQLRAAARSRRELEAARRKAVEQALLGYGLMRERSDMSRNYEAKTRTE